MSFNAAPLQSEALQKDNLPPSNAILNVDLNNPAALPNFKSMRAAEEHLEVVRDKWQSTDNATIARHKPKGCIFDSNVADEVIIPQISAQAVSVNLQPLQQQILQLQQQFQQLQEQSQQQFQQLQQLQQLHHQNANLISVRVFTSITAIADHTLTPPPYGGQPVPGNFPTTINAILALSDAELTEVENYYALGHAGVLQMRRIRVRRAYGVGFLVVY